MLCDREFDSKDVFQTLLNLGIEYLISTRISTPEAEALETMEDDGEAIAVEQAEVHIAHDSHAMQYLYVPSTKGKGTAVFATDLSVEPDETETFCRRYSRRWHIEIPLLTH